MIKKVDGTGESYEPTKIWFSVEQKSNGYLLDGSEMFGTGCVIEEKETVMGINKRLNELTAVIEIMRLMLQNFGIFHNKYDLNVDIRILDKEGKELKDE